MNSLKSIRGSAVFCNLGFNNGLKAQRCFGTSSVAFRREQISGRPAVKIPMAIPRSSTDILKALAKTVEPDYTGPRYQYVDDPLLEPKTFMDKKQFLYSKEAGRKAARYFFDKYPYYFYRDLSEPKIEAFTYREIYKDGMEFEIYDLERCLATTEVNNAIICYKGLRKQGVEIEPEVVNDLFDLVCFYNSEDAPERQLDDEWFGGRRETSTKLLTNTWKADSFAEELFESIEPKTSKMYSSLIQGLCRFGNIDRAFTLYQQAIDLKFRLNTGTYNELISVVDRKHGTNDERWQEILKIYRMMKKNGIKPDLDTLNNSLAQIEKYVFWDPAFKNAKKIYNEFCFNFDIIPTRRTNMYMLEIQRGAEREREVPQKPDDTYGQI